MKFHIFVILIFLLLLFVPFSLALPNEQYEELQYERMDARSFCDYKVYKTPETCVTIEHTHQRTNLEYFDCVWGDERVKNECTAGNFVALPNELLRKPTIPANSYNLLKLEAVGPTIILIIGFVLSFIVFAYYYFKKAISKEKPSRKKFLIASILMLLIEIVWLILGGISLSSTFQGLDYMTIEVPIALSIVFIAPLIIFNYLIIRYYIKTETKKAIFLGVIISCLAYSIIIIGIILYVASLLYYSIY